MRRKNERGGNGEKTRRKEKKKKKKVFGLLIVLFVDSTFLSLPFLSFLFFFFCASIPMRGGEREEKSRCGGDEGEMNGRRKDATNEKRRNAGEEKTK